MKAAIKKNTKPKPAKQRSMLTEEQAWKVVAVVFRRRTGMCRVAFLLKECGLVDCKTHARMAQRIYDEGTRLNLCGWFWDFVEAGARDDDKRVTTATKFAEVVALRKKKR